MNEQERIENLETQVKELARVARRILFHLSLTGDMPPETNAILVKDVRAIIKACEDRS